MPNGRRKVGVSGGWMQPPPSAGSSHSSPASSVKSSNFGGEYGNPNHPGFPQQTQQQAGMQQPIQGDRMNASVMGHQNQHSQQHHMQMQQQQQSPHIQQPSPTQHQYGNPSNSSFYSQYGQAPSHTHQMMQQPQSNQQQQQQQQQQHTPQQPQQQLPQQFSPQQHQGQQRLPGQDGVHNQHFFNQSNANVNPYGYPAGPLPPTGLDGSGDMGQYGGGSWVSAVPTSSFVSAEGSAITKSQNYPREQIHQNHPSSVQQQQGEQLSGVSYQQHQQHQHQQQQPQHQQQQPQHQIQSHPQAVPQTLNRPVPTKFEQGEEDEEDADENEDENGDGESKKRQTHQKGASEFVKKLFRMLDDTSYSSIVSWGPMGDSFIVRDMNDFTKFVLPRHFRHSNFASFVRQLNKYDFHKVNKKAGDGQPLTLGVDQQWEFKHPAFIKGREDMLDRVKRKALPIKKGKKGKNDSPREDSPSMPGLADAAEKGAQEYSQLKEQVATLTASQDQMTNHINNLTKQYQAVIGEMLTFQKNMVQQDQLMQNLIQYLMNLEADRKIDTLTAAPTSMTDSSRPQLENNGAFVSSSDAEKLVSSFSDVAKESFSQMSQIAQRAAMSGSVTGSSVTSTGTVAESSTIATTVQRRMSDDGGLSPKSSLATPSNMHIPSPSMEKGKERDMHDGSNRESSIFLHPPHLEADDPSSNDLFSAAANAINNPTLAGFEDVGLRVFTVGTLQPRSENADTNPEALQAALSRNPPSGKGLEESNRPFGISVPNLEQLPPKMPRLDGRTTPANPTPKTGSGEDGNDPSTPSEGGSNLLRIRRSTYVPGWAVPPKVLVVDDDDVCRKLGSKFLQVFGCAIDVAVDGVTAVNKMNLEKYDLVLMDIVMPNLDGVSATSLIREFDARTPIISMTSNSGPQELLSYMSSGMNDVLPKPFTKEGLLNMLEKHLIHLKTVQKMDEIPKALGLPPISGDVMQNVLSATAASANSIGSSAAHLTPSDGANPMAAMMGNGPEALRQSQEASGSAAGGGIDGSGQNHGFDENGEGLVNPLAGMGFSDEEYISMLQNLIAAGAVSDTNKGEIADTVANVMGVARGEGSMAANLPRSKESTPTSGLNRGSMLPPQHGVSRKRSNENGVESAEVKKSRFTEMSSI